MTKEEAKELVQHLKGNQPPKTTIEEVKKYFKVSRLQKSGVISYDKYTNILWQEFMQAYSNSISQDVLDKHKWDFLGDDEPHAPAGTVPKNMPKAMVDFIGEQIEAPLPQETQEPEKPKKRKRRTKKQIEADKAKENNL